MRKRLAAVLSLAFLAQLSLFGGERRCAAVVGTQEVVGHSAEHGAPEAPPPGHEHETPGNAPCSATSMCGVMMLVADAGVRDGRDRPQGVRRMAAAARPASVPRAPDLPPPRA